VSHLGQLPAQVHRILHTDVEALTADRGNATRRGDAARITRAF